MSTDEDAVSAPDTARLSHLVICGGGITGLAAAWEAVQRGVPRVTVLDSAAEMGGKLRTSEVGGLMVDEGADAFLIRVPAALELCRELGIDDRLINPAAGNAELWWNEERHRFPEGLVLGVPTSPEDLAGCAFLSPGAAQCVSQELQESHEPVVDDQSIGQFMRHRFGDEITDLLVEPLIGGINAGSIDALSLDAVVPQLAAAARQPGSFAANLAESRRLAPSSGPIFATTDSGIRPMVDALIAALEAAGVHLVTSARVTRIERSDITDAGAPKITIRTANGPDSPSGEEAFIADGVILALPAQHLAHAMAGIGAIPELLAGIPTASVVVVTMVWDSEPFDLDAAGILIPRTDDSTPVTAISFGSTKWPRLAVQKGSGTPSTVLRVSLGHDGHDNCAGWSDEELIAEAARQVHQILGSAPPAAAVRVSRWPDGFTQYRPGHLSLTSQIDAELDLHLGMAVLAGSAFHGIGIPSSIASGRAGVAQLLDRCGAFAVRSAH